MSISVGQEIKAQGKWLFYQVAPCQNYAESKWCSSCRKSLNTPKYSLSKCIESTQDSPCIHQALNPLMRVLISPGLILGMKAVQWILLSLQVATKRSFQEKQIISIESLVGRHLLWCFFPPIVISAGFIEIVCQSSFPKKGQTYHLFQ